MMLRKCIEEGGGKGASEWVVGGGGGWEGGLLVPLTFSRTINHSLLFLGVTSRERRQWKVGRCGGQE